MRNIVLVSCLVGLLSVAAGQADSFAEARRPSSPKKKLSGRGTIEVLIKFREPAPTGSASLQSVDARESFLRSALKAPERAALRALKRFGATESRMTFPDDLLRASAEHNARASLSQDEGARAVDTGLNRFRTVTLPKGAKAGQFVSRLSGLPDVELAFENKRGSFFATPNDPLFSSQWALPKISAPAAWDVSKGNKSVKIAVVDSGIQMNHPDLAANISTTLARDFADAPGAPCAAGEDCLGRDNDPTDLVVGHGTHVSGIAAGVGFNGVGISGICPSCEIIPIRVGGTFGLELDDTLAGLEWARLSGSNVVNMSFGIVLNTETSAQDRAVRDQYNVTLNALADSGAVLVAAAGNSNVLTKFTYPAAHPRVIAVAATDINDVPATFSNFGPEVALAAPGVNILSTYPSSLYRSLSGTSMASPYLAGAIALFQSRFTGGRLPGVTLANQWSETKAHLISATDTIPANSKSITRRLNVKKLMDRVVVVPPPQPQEQLINPQTTDLSWQMIGAGKFSSAVTPSLVWRNMLTGDVAIWFMNGVLRTGATTPSIRSAPVEWRLVSVFDIDRNGTSDLIWHNQSTGQSAVWRMSGTTVIKTEVLPNLVRDWRLVGAGDVDGNGIGDLVWHQESTGQVAAWFMGDPSGVWTMQSTAIFSFTAKLPWNLMGVGEFDGDGVVNDLLWYNSQTREVAYWFLQGSAAVQGSRIIPTLAPALPSATSAWKVGAIANFGGSGISDILWSTTAGTGTQLLWTMP